MRAYSRTVVRVAVAMELVMGLCVFVRRTVMESIASSLALTSVGESSVIAMAMETVHMVMMGAGTVYVIITMSHTLTALS